MNEALLLEMLLAALAETDAREVFRPAQMADASRLRRMVEQRP